MVGFSQNTSEIFEPLGIPSGSVAFLGQEPKVSNVSLMEFIRAHFGDVDFIKTKNF